MEGPTGRQLTVRALLDSGAQASFVSESVAQLLHARRRRVKVTMSGLRGMRMAEATTETRLIIKSPSDATLRLETDAYVLRRLSNFAAFRASCHAYVVALSKSRAGGSGLRDADWGGRHPRG